MEFGIEVKFSNNINIKDLTKIFDFTTDFERSVTVTDFTQFLPVYEWFAFPLSVTAE